MSNHIAEQPESAYLIQQLDVVSGRYETIAVALDYGLAARWTAGDMSTVEVNDVRYSVRRFEKMRISYE